MTLIGNAIKAAKQGIKAAPKAKPFYSAVDKAALELARPKGTGKEFMTELKKTKGVKPTEIEHRKLEQIEQLPKMTKEQFLAELEKRPPAEVSENVLEPKTKKMRDDIAEELFPGGYDYTNYRDLRPDQRQQVDEVMATRTTAYGDYQIPGGENYREILLQLPHFMDEERLMYLDAKRRHGGLHPVLAREYEQLKEQKASFNPEYLSRHWEGNPNVLAHMRVSDRMVEQQPEMRYVAINKKSGFPSQDFATPEELDAYIQTLPENIRSSLVVKQTPITKPPKKILHVEEIQSDWHQEGREKGYKTKESLENWYNQNKLENDPPFAELNSEQINTIERNRNAGMGGDKSVPDAPFKKNWHELAMKRLINYASENGYDGIAITPGAEQAKRYDLSKQVDSLSYQKNPDETYRLTAKVKGNNHLIGESLNESQLEQQVGKDVAKKIIEGSGREIKNTHYSTGAELPSHYELSGVDLQVGGEGMKGFYDKMLPDYLNQFGKPYGAQVELGGYKLKGDPSLRGEASERLGLAGERFDQMTPEEIEAFNAKLDEANAKNLHYFPITPQMREEVTQKGLPLYQQIGIPLGAGTAGTQIEVPQAPVQPEPTEEPAYAMGGAVYDTTPDMSDGGQILQGDAFKRGGKVHITDNPDTMFMELHDKKLAGGGLLKKALQAAKPAIKGMQEVLPVAEREANLKKFLAPSAEKRRMYHGSKEPNIKEFKTRKEMTDEYNMTGHYADERDAVFLSPEPQFTKHFSQEGYTDTHQAPTTYPVHVQIERPFDFDNPEHLEKVKQTYLDMYHNPESDLYDPYMLPSERSMAIHTFNKRVDNLPNDENNWARIENKDFQEVIKDLGFDSFYTRERGTKNLGVYEPNRIKSAIGNCGTYDINEPDINKRIGGLTHITRK